MARARTVVETVTCDVCGRPVKKPTTKAISYAGEMWELDLCAADLAAINRQIAQWTARARPAKRRRTHQQAEDEWRYLESLGFKRHRGRKSAAETAALAKRR